MPTIVIVDDDRVLLSSLARLLAGRDLHVEVFDTAEAAMKWLDQGGQPDVVISDHSLPGQGGLDFLRALHERCPTAGRILHTGDAAVTEKLIDADFAVLLKPVPPTLLRQVVDRLLGREMPAPW